VFEREKNGGRGGEYVLVYVLVHTRWMCGSRSDGLQTKQIDIRCKRDPQCVCLCVCVCALCVCMCVSLCASARCA